MGHARHLAGTGDDEMESVQGNEVEAVRTPQVETPEHKQEHEDLLREGLRDAGAAQGIGEDGVDITESDGPYLQGGDDVS
jgi:citrate lyase beta subunit